MRDEGRVFLGKKDEGRGMSIILSRFHLYSISCNVTRVFLLVLR